MVGLHLVEFTNKSNNMYAVCKERLTWHSFKILLTFATLDCCNTLKKKSIIFPLPFRSWKMRREKRMMHLKVIKWWIYIASRGQTSREKYIDLIALLYIELPDTWCSALEEGRHGSYTDIQPKTIYNECHLAFSFDWNWITS